MIKPDGVQRGLVGEIISRFEKKGFKLVAMKVMQASVEHLEKHYADLSSKGFFRGLVTYMASGPVCAMVWEGLNAGRLVVLCLVKPTLQLPSLEPSGETLPSMSGATSVMALMLLSLPTTRLPSGSSRRSSVTGPLPRRTGSMSRSILTSTFWSLPLT